MAREQLRQIHLGDIAVDVIRKDIMNLHLSVHPPTGRVRISAPLRMDLATIRVFAIAKLGWIRNHQRKFSEQDREPPRDYIDRESHFVWGRRCLLRVEEADAAPSVELKHKTLVMRVRQGTSRTKRQSALEDWYREKLKEALHPILAKWQPLVGVRVRKIFVQQMKTKWGSCSPSVGNIRLNTELAKKPPECLEYIVVHEMAHLIEPTHNRRFMALMERFMPKWEFHRTELNRLPVRHEDWDY